MSKKSIFLICVLFVATSQALVSPQWVCKQVGLSSLSNPRGSWTLQAETDEEDSVEPNTDMDSSPSESTKLSLEEKMKSWEATEEEVRASTLGGVVPGGNAERSDAFDVGLYIAFPIIVLSSLAFAFFPFIMGNLDVDSVGPPPTL